MRSTLWLTLLLLSLSSPLSGATGIFKEFIAPTPGSGPTSLADGHDGSLWFTEFHANKIGRIARDGTVSEFAIPTPNSGPMGIAWGGDGGVWFTEFNANKIGRINPQGVITEYPVPTPDSGPFDISRGSSELWFSELRGNKIGRIRFDGVISEFPVPTADSEPMGVGRGPDGEIWFTEFRGNKIGTLFANGTVREIPILTPGSGPVDLSMGSSSGRVWFTQFHARKIGRVYLDGVVTEYSLPPGSTGPWGIVADYYGSGAWFTARTGHRIGYVVPDGRVTEYPLPNDAAEPMGIEQQLEKVFYAARAGNSVGSMQPDIVVVPGAGLIGGWDTDIRFAIPEFQSTTVFAGLNPIPPVVCPGSCGPLAQMEVPPLGSGRVVLSNIQFSPFLTNWYVRSLETGNLPAVHARMFNRARPDQAGELRARPALHPEPARSDGPHVPRGLEDRDEAEQLGVNRREDVGVGGAFRSGGRRSCLDRSARQLRGTRGRRNLPSLLGRNAYVGRRLADSRSVLSRRRADPRPENKWWRFALGLPRNSDR